VAAIGQKLSLPPYDTFLEVPGHVTVE
jgi:hypothetical protein